jgi:hypothetical protein
MRSKLTPLIHVSLPYTFIYTASSLGVYTPLHAVTNYLLLLTLLLLRGNPKIWRHGKLAECFCVGLSLVLPAAYVWMPIRDGIYEAPYSDKWDTDVIIFNIAVLVLCLEVLIVSLTLCSLFCYLRRVYKTQRQLTTVA